MSIDEQDNVVGVRDDELAMDPDRADQLLRGLLEVKRGKPAADGDERVERRDLRLGIVQVGGDDARRLSGVNAHRAGARRLWRCAPRFRTLDDRPRSRSDASGRGRPDAA